jgi:hypothetical protein
MDIEARSIEFLEWHMENGYKRLMADKIMLDMEWEEGYDGGENWIRPVARMRDPMDNASGCNTLCLFPPFFPNRPNNYYKELLKK